MDFSVDMSDYRRSLLDIPAIVLIEATPDSRAGFGTAEYSIREESLAGPHSSVNVTGFVDRRTPEENSSTHGWRDGLRWAIDYGPIAHPMLEKARWRRPALN